MCYISLWPIGEVAVVNTNGAHGFVVPENARRYEQVEEKSRILYWFKHMIEGGTIIEIGKPVRMEYETRPCLAVPILEDSGVTGFLLTREIPALHDITINL